MRENIINLTKKLTLTAGISGNENAAATLATEFLKNIGEVSTTNLGSVVCNYSCGIQNAPKILLTAHLDQIGMIVTNVLKDGFLKVAQVGGVDRRLLPSQRVIVQTSEKNINGVVCSTPPHLQEGKETVIKMKDVLIDTGLSGEDANVLSVGDTVCFAPCFEVLNNKILAATALDDRIGCVAIMLATEKIKTDKIPCDVCVLLASQEETGSAGAVADIAKITPDMAIAVDVSFADGFDIDKEKCGKLGGGVMVGLSPVLNRNLFKQMLKIAQEKNIKYQTEIMGGRTGTDADVVAMSKNGIKTALLSIPQRYMHTPCEVVSINDVKTVIDLIYEFAKEASI